MSRRAAVVVVLGLMTAAALAGVRSGARGQAAGDGNSGHRDEHALRSSIIYPPQQIAIRMDHSIPEHRRLKCVRCHEGAGRSRKVSDSLMPDESTCLPCHRERIRRDRPESSERCGFCHVGYGEGAGMRVPRSHMPSARLKFSHARHVRFEPHMKCLECHSGVDRDTLGTRAHMPTMKTCFRCHGGASPQAPSECTTCHLTRPDGKIRARWGEQWMNPPRWLFGMHHDRDWMVRHRWVGADQGSKCASCHRDSECADCHDGRVRPERVHPNDYLTIHPQMARRDSPQCTSCHTTQTFCNECHARLGISPNAAPLVRTSKRFHPPADVWVRGPVRHADEARRSMTTCSSCHAERDCVRCHGAFGVGSGISPHPPGFIERCARALKQNDRACRTCHGDVDALRARCR